MKDYFLPKSTSYDLRRNDVPFVPKIKTTNHGIRSISFLGPKIWNFLPNEIKLPKNANQFKILIKDWYFENNAHATLVVNKFQNAISVIIEAIENKASPQQQQQHGTFFGHPV